MSFINNQPLIQTIIIPKTLYQLINTTNPSQKIHKQIIANLLKENILKKYAKIHLFRN